MHKAGFEPDFCIPKEMLRDLALILPKAAIVHVGDDARRHRDIAQRAGVAYVWPHQASE